MPGAAVARQPDCGGPFPFLPAPRHRRRLSHPNLQLFRVQDLNSVRSLMVNNPKLLLFLMLSLLKGSSWETLGGPPAQ